MSLQWHGDKVKAAVRRGALRGLRRWGDDVMKESRPQVPVAKVKGGFTRDSGKVSVDEAKLRVAVSYDSPPGTHLAIWVHENMTNQHPIGNAKFLSHPANASRKSGPATVAAEIRRELQ